MSEQIDMNRAGLLSPCQREIVRRLAEGATTKAIAIDLGLSPKGVEYHRVRIYRILRVDSVARLTRFAIVSGISPLTEGGE